MLYAGHTDLLFLLEEFYSLPVMLFTPAGMVGWPVNASSSLHIRARGA
jgi:hypothetical protein